MINSTTFLNWDALKEAAVQQEPFPFAVIPNLIQQPVLNSLVESFPTIKNRGSIPSESVKSESIFQNFLSELKGPAFRQVIAEKFELDLKDKPTLLTLRGYTTERDGHIHTDSKDKLITVLLYMNPTWDTPEGKLRLLNSKQSLNDYFAEISPLAGSCLIFKVTPNCWHGHSTFIGKRLSLQLNYLSSEAAFAKHHHHHRFSATLKRLFPKLFPAKEENYY